MTRSRTTKAEHSSEADQLEIKSAVLAFVLLRANNDDELEVLLLEASPRQPDERWHLPECRSLLSAKASIESSARRYLHDVLATSALASPANLTPLRLVGAYPRQNESTSTAVSVMIVYSGIVARTVQRGASTSTRPAHLDRARWIKLDKLEHLTLPEHQADAIADALDRTDEVIGYGRRDEFEPELIFTFLPKRFTLPQAQAIIEAIKRKEVDKSNFRKFMSSRIRESDNTIGTRTKPAVLFEQKWPLCAQENHAIDIDLYRKLQDFRGALKNVKNHGKAQFFDDVERAPVVAQNFVAALRKLPDNRSEKVCFISKGRELLISEDWKFPVSRPLENTELMQLRWSQAKNAFRFRTVASPWALDRALNQLNIPEMQNLRKVEVGPFKSEFTVHLSRPVSGDRPEQVRSISEQHVLDYMQIILSECLGALEERKKSKW